MGQGQSCIQGTPDWLGPYEKPSGKATTEEKDLYDHLSELIFVSNITKDYSALENFLSKANKSHLSLGSSVLPSNKNNTSTMDSNVTSSSKHSPTKLQLEELFHKETQCKSVNFSQEPKDFKSPNVKPVIAKKKCTIHGSEHKQVSPTQHRHNGCYHESQSPPAHGHSQNSRQSQKIIQKSVHFSPTTKNSSKPSASISPANTNSATGESNRKNISKQCALHPASAILHEKMNAVMPSTEVRIAQNIDTRIIEDFPLDAEDSRYPDILKDLMSFPATEPESSDLFAALAVQSAKDTIQRLEDRAETIVETFAVVLKHLEHGDWSTFCISSSRLCDDIRKVLRDYNVSSDAADLEEIKIKNHVTSALNQLTGHILQSNLVPTGEYTNDLLPSFQMLGEVLHELMEFLISKELTVIVQSLHQTSTYCVKESVCTLAEMSASGGLMCKLIKQVGGFTSIITICEEDRCNDITPLALRTLAMLASSQNSITQLEMTAGLKLVIKTLESKNEKETVKSEAVGFLAQIIKLWSENGTSIEQQVKGYLNKLVKSLIDVAQKTHSSEAFLLSAASISSLSTCSSEASQWLLDHKQEMRLLAAKTKQESYV